MVKTKGGRLMNPTDAFRKEQRKKEIARNKMERKFQREAHSKKERPDELKTELQTIIDLEQEGPLPKNLRLRKKVLQDAFDQALKRKKEEENRKKQEAQAAAGASRPEDSRYYHPQLNPTGAPPPGKMPTAVGPGGLLPTPAIPVPKPPPLPPGPAPTRVGLPPPPAAPPLPAGPAPTPDAAPSTSAAGTGPTPLPPPPGPPPTAGTEPPSSSDGSKSILPPPSGPPPGMLPPPPGPPPGVPILPPPSGPPPGVPLPPPAGPPPTHILPPPSGPPPAMAGILPPPAGPPPIFPVPPSLAASMPPPGSKKETKTTITGASTVVKLPKAQSDRSVTALIPASVRVRREDARVKPGKQSTKDPSIGPGFGLAPQQKTIIPSAAPEVQMRGGVDAKYEAFLQEISSLGAFEMQEL